MDPLGKAIVAGMLVVTLALVGGGGYLLVQRETGARVQAKITDCVESGGSRNRQTRCTGTWIAGGSLVGGDGHVVVGTVQGADAGDVGRTVDATASGDTAYSRSPLLPILLIGLGLLTAVGLVLLLRGSPTRRRGGTAS